MERILLVLILAALAVGCGSDYDGYEEDQAYERGYEGGDEPSSGDASRSDAFDLGRFDSDCDELKRKGRMSEWNRRRCAD